MRNGTLGAVRLVVFAAVAGIFCATATAKPIKVKKGDDLQAAIDAAPDGATIVIRRGTYAPITLNNRTGLNIRGVGRPTIDGTGVSNGVQLNGCTDVTISGLLVRDTDSSAIFGDGGSGVIIRRCIILNAGDEGIEFANGDSITIERNRIDGTQDDGIAVSDGSEDQTHNSTISRNSIRGVPDGGIDVHGDNNTVIRNVVVQSSYCGVLVAIGTGNKILNNRIVDIDGDGIIVEGQMTTVSGNLVRKMTGHGIDLLGDSETVTRNSVARAAGVGIRVQTEMNEVTKNRISRSGTVDLQDTSGGDTNTYTGNRARTLEPENLPNPRR